MIRHVALLALLVMVVTVAACGGGTAAPTAAPTVAPVAKAPAQPTIAPAAKPAPTQAPAAKAPTLAPTAVGKVVATAPAARKYSGPPPMSIDASKIYVATIETDKGNIVMELYPADAPQHVNNFVFLANDGFFNGLTFHRVEPGFVIQGGDPSGNGTGGPGYVIPAEIKRKHPEGALAAARTGDNVNPKRDSSGSQFYITLAATPNLDGAYTSYGQVVQGMDVAKKITRGDKINKVTITTK
jgi:peptidylprolyl isomerase